MPKRNSKTSKYIIIGVVAIIIAYVVASNIQIDLGDVNWPDSSQQGNTNYYYSNSTSNTQSTDSLNPTSLTLTVTPSSSPMGSWVYGEVTGNGYNVPISIHAKLLGTDQIVNYGALLSSDGTYHHSQQMYVPGHYDFWVTTGSITSNTVSHTVEGLQVTASGTYYSRTLQLPITFKVYSSFTGSVQLFANDAAHSVSVPLGTVTMNSDGYGEISLKLGSLANGNYEIDVVQGGQKASDYGAICQMEVGR